MRWHSAVLPAAFLLLLSTIQGSLALQLRLNATNFITLADSKKASASLFKILLEKHNYQAILQLLKWSSFETQDQYLVCCPMLTVAHLGKIANFSALSPVTDALDLLLPPDCLAAIPVTVWQGLNFDQTVPTHFSKIITSLKFNAHMHSEKTIRWILRTSLQSTCTSVNYNSFFQKSHPRLFEIIRSLGTSESTMLFWQVTKNTFSSNNPTTVGILLNQIIMSTKFGLISQEDCQIWGLATQKHLSMILCRIVSLLALVPQPFSCDGLINMRKRALKMVAQMHRTLGKWHTASNVEFTRYMASLNSLLKLFVHESELTLAGFDVKTLHSSHNFSSLFNSLVSYFDSADGNGCWMLNLFALFSEHLAEIPDSSLADAIECFLAHDPAKHAVKGLLKLFPKAPQTRYPATPVAKITALMNHLRCIPGKVEPFPLASRQAMLIKRLRSSRTCIEPLKLHPNACEGPIVIDEQSCATRLTTICKSFNVRCSKKFHFIHQIIDSGRLQPFTKLVRAFLLLFKNAGSAFYHRVGTHAQDGRPVIVLSPALPEKIIYVFSTMLIFAVAYNVSIPFLLEWNFFATALYGEPTLSENLVNQHPKSNCALNAEVIEFEKMIKADRHDMLEIGASAKKQALNPHQFFGQYFLHKFPDHGLLTPEELYAFVFKCAPQTAYTPSG